ncbi:MAG: outer membrane protein assembly factor BamE [Alphaproteobacteria bacterium]|nr:MAG: outer membrane protein assembly factor BamE [Alphaproteobacteria bacterium]
MSRSSAFRFASPIAAAVLLSLTLSACSSGMSLVQNKQRGYDISEDDVKQIRPGQSAALVTAVLGSPQSTNSFAKETAWIYIGEKVQQTAFGMELSKQRTVLVIYFDKNNKVTDMERLGVKDGRSFQIESRRTPSFGQDRTFLESIISSI